MLLLSLLVAVAPVRGGFTSRISGHSEVKYLCILDLFELTTLLRLALLRGPTTTAVTTTIIKQIFLLRVNISMI